MDPKMTPGRLQVSPHKPPEEKRVATGRPQAAWEGPKTPQEGPGGGPRDPKRVSRDLAGQLPDKLSGICPAFVRQLSGIVCQVKTLKNHRFSMVFIAFVRHLSGICPAIVWLLSGICPAIVRQDKTLKNQ